MGKYRYLKPRYWNKRTSSRTWIIYRVKSLYYRIRRIIISFLSFVLSASLILCAAVIVLAFVMPDDSPTVNVPDVNSTLIIPEKAISPDNVLNIVGAEGHRITLKNNVSAVDPSYTELLNFLRVDQTDKIQYNYSSFVCADFAETVHNNAEKEGIKAGFVSIDFTEISGGHACNVFNTTDRGLIFIDCTNSLGDQGPSNNDRIVTVQDGCTYYPHYLFASGRWRTLPMGTVKTYETYW